MATVMASDHHPFLLCPCTDAEVLPGVLALRSWSCQRHLLHVSFIVECSVWHSWNLCCVYSVTGVGGGGGEGCNFQRSVTA